MVNRYPAAGGQVPKVTLTVMQFARWNKEQRMQKSLVLCRSIIGWCVPIKVAYLEFFPELQIFSTPELEVELFTVISRKTLT